MTNQDLWKSHAISYHIIKVYHIATHLSTIIRWQVCNCQSKLHFDDQPTVSTSKPDQGIADSAIFGGCQRRRPWSYPTLSNYKSSIVILAVRRGWYHTRVSFVVKKNGKVRLRIYWYFYHCIRLITKLSLHINICISVEALKEIVVNLDPRGVAGV